jgi:hypothetical protein
MAASPHRSRWLSIQVVRTSGRIKPNRISIIGRFREALGYRYSPVKALRRESMLAIGATIPATLPPKGP